MYEFHIRTYELGSRARLCVIQFERGIKACPFRMPAVTHRQAAVTDIMLLLRAVTLRVVPRGASIHLNDNGPISYRRYCYRSGYF